MADHNTLQPMTGLEDPYASLGLPDMTQFEAEPSPGLVEMDDSVRSFVPGAGVIEGSAKEALRQSGLEDEANRGAIDTFLRTLPKMEERPGYGMYTQDYAKDFGFRLPNLRDVAAVRGLSIWLPWENIHYSAHSINRHGKETATVVIGEWSESDSGEADLLLSPLAESVTDRPRSLMQAKLSSADYDVIRRKSSYKLAQGAQEVADSATIDQRQFFWPRSGDSGDPIRTNGLITARKLPDQFLLDNGMMAKYGVVAHVARLATAFGSPVTERQKSVTHRR